MSFEFEGFENNWKRFEDLLVRLGAGSPDSIKQRLKLLDDTDISKSENGIFRYEIDASETVNIFGLKRIDGDLNNFLVNSDMPVAGYFNGSHIHIKFTSPHVAVEGRLLVCEHESILAWINELFIGTKPTGAETRTLIQLLCGQPLAKAASADGVSYETKRAHLKAISAKLGVSRQQDIVSILLTLVIQKLQSQAERETTKTEYVSRYLEKHAKTARLRWILGKSGSIHRVVEFGPLWGRPVLVLHSPIPTPLEGGPLEYLFDNGIRLICPLRPGALEPTRKVCGFREYLEETMEGVEAAIEMFFHDKVTIVSLLTSDYFAVAFAARWPELVRRVFIVASSNRSKLSLQSDAPFRKVALKFAVQNEHSYKLVLKALSLKLKTVSQYASIIRYIYRDGTPDRDSVERELTNDLRVAATFDAVTNSQCSFLNDTYSQRFSLMEGLKRLDCPVTFIHGAQDAINPIENIEAIVEQSSNTDLQSLEGCGQIINDDHLVAALDIITRG